MVEILGQTVELLCERAGDLIMKRYIISNHNLSSKSALIQILKDIKDKVIVTGSYAYGMQNEDSDIDFFINLLH